MRKTILIIALLAIANVICDDCKDVKCPSPPKHYEEFGCTPVEGKAGECCPSQYDCSSLKSRNATLCHYNNDTIEIGEEFHNKDIEASCTIGCRCQGSDDENEVASLQCTHIDCPEFFGGPKVERGKTCINQYEEKSCCISSTVCGEELNKLEKCHFDGKSYYEGQRIDTGRSCYSCLCGKGWEDKPVEDNKHCHKINCNMELHYYTRMLDGCVPVYYQTDDCCPIEWRCPDNTTTVVPDSTRKAEISEIPESSLSCTFGELKMKLGDFLSPENDYDQCTLCSCKVPPYPHCIKTC